MYGGKRKHLYGKCGKCVEEEFVIHLHYRAFFIDQVFVAAVEST